MRKTTLLILMVIFFGQLFLRAHQPTSLPLFVDEDRHMQRAAQASYDYLTINNHGKILLYVLIAPFNTTRDTALHLSRTMVALFSLIGTAGLFALVRALFDERAGLLAAAFYALAPYAAFYERMVLADGPAGAWGILVAWQSVHLARQPSYRRAVIVGALVAMAMFAKLTMGLVAMVPILAFLFLADYQPRDWIGHIRRNFRYLFVAGITSIVLWIPVITPVILAELRGEYYILVNRYLVGESLLEEGNFDKLVRVGETLTLLLSPWMVALLVVQVAGALHRFPRRAGFLLSSLLVLWLPTILLVGWVETRYFVPGIYMIGALFAVGVVALREQYRIGVAVLAVWVIVFVAPFASRMFQNSPDIDLIPRDESQYYQSEYSAHAWRDALAFLSVEAPQQPVLGVGFLCNSIAELYPQPHVSLDCLAARYSEQMEEPFHSTIIGQPILEVVHQGQDAYVLVEDERDIPYVSPELEWERVREYRKPKDGMWLTLWRVYSSSANG